MRFCFRTADIGENPVVTINEEISYEMGYGDKLNPKIKVDYSQVLNAPQRNCWSILPYEHLNIAYSRIVGRKPMNTVEHFRDVAENFNFNVLKADVEPTSDGELVCCHDKGFTFDANGNITYYDPNNATLIYDKKAEECIGYTHPTGEHVCLIGDFLSICRQYGKVAFITIRERYMDVVIPKLLSELKKHNMMYSTIINSMTYDSLVKWRMYDTSIMTNYTLHAGQEISIETIDKALAIGYCSHCGLGFTSSNNTPDTVCNFEYARERGVRLLQSIAYTEGSVENCYALGYDGCQIAYAWNPKQNTNQE
jgi:glycerophosphoryl diester phosphodiesterase